MTYKKGTQTEESVCVVNVHIIHHDVYVHVGVSTRIVVVYNTMGTQIEHATIWHNNGIVIHGEHIVHIIIGIMQ